MSNPHRRIGRDVEAEAVRIACRHGGLAAAEATGINHCTVRRWCEEWHVPFVPPVQSDATLRAAVWGLVRGFTNP